MFDNVKGKILRLASALRRRSPAAESGAARPTGKPMPEPEAGPTMGDLADASRVDLFQFQDLKAEQWYMRLSVADQARGWELLSGESKELNSTIKRRIRESEAPVTDLVLAFLGHVHWRGRQQLMVHMQYFRHDDPMGLLFGSHVRQAPAGGTLEPYGSPLTFGTCENIWIHTRRPAWRWSRRG